VSGVLLLAEHVRGPDVVPEELRVFRMTKPTPAQHALAAKIARALFTNGANERAVRLRLVGEYGGSLGGWSEIDAADQIARVLAEEGTA